MKFIGNLFFAGLICAAASANLPKANCKYKFYLNRFSPFWSFYPKHNPNHRSPRSRQFNERGKLQTEKKYNFSNIYF